VPPGPQPRPIAHRATVTDPGASPAAAPLACAAAVRAALDAGRPVVALETSVLAHGLPWPGNLETVHAMCDAVRAGGAVPAVVGVCAGRIRIGLDDGEMERFARARSTPKASRRDLAALVAAGRDGATTVAGTMACAALAGIEVLATGGIGGVHRGADASFDVSADLVELGRTPIAVVCSGAKAILDLPRTLEVLETAGVPVIGYGTDRFPAFFVRETRLGVTARVDSPAAAAAVIAASRGLSPGGVLVANPVAAAEALDGDEVERWVADAEGEARAAGIRGRAITPFLLERLAERSGGRTAASNRALLVANAALAARIAGALRGAI